MLSDVPTEIVVAGHALEASRAEQALAVKVIGEEELRSTAATGLEQALQQVAGLTLFRRSDARSANPTSQGVTLRALGGNAASRALLILDGVPQTDPFGGWVNWPAYDPLALGEVRVTRGGGSVVTGPGALAGTIEMDSQSRVGETAEASVGSRASLDGRMVVNERLGAGTLGLSLHGSRGNGFVPVTRETRGPVDEPAPYANVSGRARWVGRLGGGTELQASVSGFVDERSRGLPFSHNRSKGADASLRLVSRSAWQWSVLGYVQGREFESSFAVADAERTSARRTSLQHHVPGRAFGWSAEIRPPLGSAVELRLGTDGRAMKGQSDELGSYINGAATRERSSGGRASHVGAFADASWTRGPLLLTGGVRIDRLRIRSGFLQERVIASGNLSEDVHYPARFEWLGTGRTGARVDLGSGAALRGAAYMGWRPPTLNELFRPFRLGSDATAANPELKPERLRGAEVGVDWQNKGAAAQVTLFRNRMSDPIANVTVAGGPGLFPQVGFVPAGGLFRQRQNLRAISVSGIEAGANWSTGPWSLAAEASWTRARVRGGTAGEALTGLRPAQTPAFAAAASASWSGNGMGAALQARYIGAQYEDDLNRLRLRPALTIDGLLRISLARHAQLVVRAENLLNAENIAGRTNDGIVERTTPRTLWFGVTLKRQG